MKRKSYIMPIVLLIFSLVVVAFFSIYHRTLNTHNHKNSKEKAISKKLKEISFEEILSTKATLDFVNNKLNKRENFNLNVNINDLLKVNNINDFSQNFENYDLRLNSKKVKKKLNFYDRKSGALSYFVRQYEIFFEVRNNNELTEYKIVDKNRIENYLFDLQVKGFVDGKLKMLSDDFYFNLNNDFSNLYERIFIRYSLISAIFGNYRGRDRSNAHLPRRKDRELSEGYISASRRRYDGIDRSRAVGERSDNTGGYLGQPQYSLQVGTGADLCRRVCMRARLGAEC